MAGGLNKRRMIQSAVFKELVKVIIGWLLQELVSNQYVYMLRPISMHILVFTLCWLSVSFVG